MERTSPVLALVDPDGTHRLVDPAAPHLRVDDLAATRGDGVFETVLVVGGRPQSLGAHLDRFARSARMLDLGEPGARAWAHAVDAVVAAHAPVAELLVRTVLSRGVEGAGRPTGWVHAWPNADHTRERTEGIDVVLLDRGYPRDVARTSPWLLQGAKTLSYAVNVAALRHAAALGADDVVFVGSDGQVLEGPKSSVVALRAGRLVTPPPELGILRGTVQARVFAWAAAAGLATGVEELTVDQLRSADALWLTSSGRLAAPVRTLDGVPVAVHARQGELTRYLLDVHD